MFTGLIEHVGAVVHFQAAGAGAVLRVAAGPVAADARIGDSVAVNGCCLTVVGSDGGTLAFDAVPETLGRTTLGALRPGDPVNIEPALRAGDPLGGHFVQGHVDGVGRVQSIEAEGEGLRVFVSAAPEILRYCVEKGSITVEGVSLTVAELADDAFAVALVPHTLAETTLSELAPGREVNLEVDVLAKYAERLLGGSRPA